MIDHSISGHSFCVKNRRFILLALFGVCTLLYYFGQVADFFGWRALEWEFFYEVHDTHRLLFLIPTIYACYFFGFKVMAIVTAASLVVFLPRAILMSPFPDSLLRALLFAAFVGVLCSLIRISRNKILQYMSVEALVRNNGNEIAVMGEKIEDEVFTAGDLEVNLSKRLVKHSGKIVKLTPKEYELLSCLIRNTGKVLGHAELLRNVWGMGYSQESEYLRTFISQIRHKIEDDPANPRFILTEPGVGYRLAEPERHF